MAYIEPESLAHLDFVDLMGRLSNPVQRRLSYTDIERLVQSYVDGAPIDDLARRFGVHRTTVIHHVDVSGVVRRKVQRKMTNHLVVDAIARYEDGLPLSKVALEFEVHPRTLRR